MDIFTEKLYSFLKDKIKVNQEENKMSKIKTFNDVRQDLLSDNPYRFYVLETLGKVEAYKDRLGWSTEELAARAELPVDTVKAIMAGDVLPGVLTLNGLMKAVGFEWKLDMNEEEN